MDMLGPLTAFDTFAGNILSAFVKCDDSDIAKGLGWYAEAYGIACELDPANPRQAVGVLAVLSPLCSWPENVKKARMVYATGTTYGLTDSVNKAKRILNGEPADNVVSGAKVESFFHNILGDDVKVTVDRHAIDCAYGKVMTDAERSNAVKRTKARDGYGIIRDAYSHCAAILSEEMGKVMTGAQLQATVWVYWRRAMAQANHG